MAAKTLPSQRALRQLLSYEPETGKLYWRTRDKSFFKSSGHTAEHRANMWNGAWAGKEALNSVHPVKKYKGGSLLMESVKCHRVIWKLVYNEEPEQIDHINGNPSDNRLCNLRAATNHMNQKNKGLHKNNKSGVCGVHWDKRHAKWMVQIGVNGKRVTVGYYKNLSDAATARYAAESANGFHENHGRRLSI